MKEFDRLFEIIKTLRGEAGCPWDKEQTLQSMIPGLIEETYEAVEAVENNDSPDIEEEFGDMFFLVLFVSYLAEQDGKTTVEAIVKGAADKLIRRHPHVFGNTEAGNSEQVIRNWEAIKKTETKNLKRKTPFDGIPKNLPEVQKHFKVLEKIVRNGGLVPEVKRNEWENKFHNLLESGSEEELDSFLESFLDYSFHRKLDLSAKIRSLTQKRMNDYNKKNAAKDNL